MAKKMIKKIRHGDRMKAAKRVFQKAASAKALKKAKLGDKYEVEKIDGVKHMKNKQRRGMLHQEIMMDKKKRQAKERRERQEAGGERMEPNTIEKMRREDETVVPAEDDEVDGDEAIDEFDKYFSGDVTPKLMVTTAHRPTKPTFNFLKELVHVIPNMFYYKRMDYPLKKIIEYAKNKKFTDLLIFSEKGKKLNGVYICHLPDGPTSYWKLTNLKLGAEIKGGATCNASHNPELIMNNFTTRLGRRLGRQLAALFPQAPDFKGRRSICFHNQRDFVFFRHYRYVFRDEGEKCRLQEIGPRFTLKLRYLQHGTFDSTTGEYEYLWRPDSQVDRKQMFV